MSRLTNKVASHERKLRALELRKAGATFQAIAESLGYRSVSGAHKAVTTALAETLREPANELRQLELERLDQVQFAIWERAVGGDDRAIGRLLEIMARRAKLLGLDASASSVPGADPVVKVIVGVDPYDGFGPEEQ